MDWIAIWIGLPALAAYIAHRKGRSWITAAALTFIVPPLGILAVLLQSADPKSGLPKNAAAKIRFGLLPLWVSIIWLIVGSFVSRSSEYWNVAPWIVLIAIPACVVTLGMVEVAGRKKPKENRQ